MKRDVKWEPGKLYKQTRSVKLIALSTVDAFMNCKRIAKPRLTLKSNFVLKIVDSCLKKMCCHISE